MASSAPILWYFLPGILIKLIPWGIIPYQRGTQIQQNHLPDCSNTSKVLTSTPLDFGCSQWMTPLFHLEISLPSHGKPHVSGDLMNASSSTASASTLRPWISHLQSLQQFPQWNLSRSLWSLCSFQMLPELLFLFSITPLSPTYLFLWYCSVNFHTGQEGPGPPLKSDWPPRNPVS